MKIKSFLLIAIFILGAASLLAEKVDVGRARKVAANFLQYVQAKYNTGSPSKKYNLNDPYVFIQDGAPVFYAFNTAPGFIIISGEDAYTPVIGYSFEGSFELERAPDNYLGFIQNYIDQILFIRHNGLIAGEEILQVWKDLSIDGLPPSWIDRNSRDVAPLLSSNWDQGAPYNILCPEDPAGPGGHAYVGCVATAMAQIMYYWRYPEVGEGYYCYWPWNYNYGEQCADFGNTWYSWDGMINSIDYGNAYPNAELQYHCAVSVDMDFGPSGSGSYSGLVPERLAMYWKYYEAQYMEKEWYYLDEWITMLKADIDMGHPVYYSGYNQSGEGHAFVCDGYQDDNFHFNFGWSGMGNGYYSLYYVYGFSEGQACVSNFIPSDPEYPYHASGNTVISMKSGSFTDGSGPIEDYVDNQQATWLIDAQVPGDSITGITFTFSVFDLAEGDTLEVYDGATVNDSLMGSFSGNTLPAALTGTGEKMLITFSADGSGTAAGWYAQFKAHSAVYCSGVTELTDPSGTFSDGSGSFNYHDNSTCMWKIKPPFANSITLTFNQFDTEDGFDYIRVFDGTTQVAEFSGHEIPEPVIATSGSIFLAWFANDNTNFQGWEAYYEADNVGMSDNQADIGLTICPNPAHDQLHVLFKSEAKENIKISLVNPSGQEVQKTAISGSSGRYHTILDISELPGGIYILALSSPSSILMKKVVIR